MFSNDSSVYENVHKGSAFDGVAGSPDGLGNLPVTAEDMAPPDIGPVHDFNVPRQTNAFEPGFENRPFPYGATAGNQLDFLEPDDVSSASASRSAGFTVLLVALSTGIGYAAKGGLGAATGLLVSGALANGYRAQKWWKSEVPSERHEAIVSGIFAGCGLVAGGYLGYRAMQENK